MLRPPQVREIGGEFETVSPELIAVGPVTPPWEVRHGTGPTYLETGRQALAAVEEVLRQEGRRRLIMPGFFCDTMVMPFVRRGWEVVPVPIGRDLFPLPGAIAAALPEPCVATVLHAPYFGQDPPPRLAEELAAARQVGARIVVDETHRLFTLSEVGGDFAVGSLRKTLPLVDGAYVVGLGTDPHSGADAEASELSRLRAKAMAAKRRYLDGAHGPGLHLARFRQANDLLIDRLAGRAMSRASSSLVRRLDYIEIAGRRRSNAIALATSIAERGVCLLADPRESDVVPSHLVVVVPRPRALQGALAERGIYCPIHWERSQLVATSAWPDQLLSIPVDQRYDAADMMRVAEALGGLPRWLYALSDSEAV